MKDFNLFIWLGERVSWLSWVNEDTIHIATAAFIVIVLLVLGTIAGIKLRDTENFIVPSKKITLPGLFEAFGEAILNLLEGIMGERAIKFLPLIGTIFIYILFCNVLGLIPGFAPPTDNINTNIPIALTVFVYYNAVGIKEHGFVKYFKHMSGPLIWLAPLMLTIELISHCVRPLSLSVRLFGNMTGDHMVLGIFSQLVPLVVPVIFFGLGLFVAFIQAFVFSLLSAVYIGLAIEHN